MLPKLLVRSQIEDAQWDLFIQHSEQRVVYGYSWYLDIVCKDWNALVLYSGGDFQVVMPLPIRRKFGVKILQQPLFCQYLGLFSRFELTIETAEAFLKSLCQHFSYISSYSFHPENFQFISPTSDRFPKLKIHEKHTHWLCLNSTFETIQAGYSLRRKFNLKKSEAFGWAVLNSQHIEPLVNLFRNNHASKIHGGVDERAYVLLSQLFEKLLENKCAELRYGTIDGEIHAGCLFVQEGKMGIYLFNSADDIGRKGNARTYMINKYFKDNAGNTDCFDFESPEITSIASFYEQFGANKIPFISIQKNDLRFPVKQIQKLRKWFFIKAKPGLFSGPCKI